MKLNTRKTFLLENNVSFLKDIVSDDGNIMTYCQFVKIYGNICSIHNFNQLTASLPTFWKKKKSRMVFQKHHVWLRNIKFNKSTDNCYKISNSLLALPYRVHTQWEDLLDSPIPW